jgi:hypothetical protein
VLYQLSYAPRLRRDSTPVIRAPPRGHDRAMGAPDDNPETLRHAEDDLLREQEGQGYGEDEGERDEALDDADPADEQ